MKYWLTTHWPRVRGEPASKPYFGVWVQEDKWHIIERVAPGDLVLVYEAESGPTIVRRAEGGESKLRRQVGRGGIVAVLQVTEAASQPPDAQREEYADGTSAWWRYCAPTTSLDSGGFIPRLEVNRLLGYAEAFNFHGFGDSHSGVKLIPRELFENLRRVYRASSEAADEERIATRMGHPTFGGTGEGAEHRTLKERIAADPAGVLGEVGLTFWRMEWLLPTADRVDVVLKDRFGRFVAVEVEVVCGADEVIGPLQCMKYRAMISYVFERPMEEVRSMLVAHAIHRVVVDRCGDYQIETRCVARAEGVTFGDRTILGTSDDRSQ